MIRFMIDIRKTLILPLFLCLFMHLSACEDKKKGEENKGEENKDTSSISKKEPVNPNAEQVAAMEKELEQTYDNSMVTYGFEAKKKILETLFALSESLLKLDPDNSTAVAVKGLAFLRQEKYEVAKEICSIAEKKDPDNFRVQFCLGTAEVYYGDSNRAIDYLLKAQTLNPEYGPTYSNLAGAYRQIGDYQKSFEYNKKFLTLNTTPRFVCGTLAEMSLCQYKLGNLETAKDYDIQATKSFETQLTGKPDDAYILFELAFWKKSYDQNEDAITYLKKALALKEDFAEGWLLLGQTLYHTHKIDESKEALNKSCALQNKDACRLVASLPQKKDEPQQEKQESQPKEKKNPPDKEKKDSPK